MFALFWITVQFGQIPCTVTKKNDKNSLKTKSLEAPCLTPKILNGTWKQSYRLHWKREMKKVICQLCKSRVEIVLMTSSLNLERAVERIIVGLDTGGARLRSKEWAALQAVSDWHTSWWIFRCQRVHLLYIVCMRLEEGNWPCWYDDPEAIIESADREFLRQWDVLYLLKMWFAFSTAIFRAFKTKNVLPPNEQE